MRQLQRRHARFYGYQTIASSMIPFLSFFCVDRFFFKKRSLQVLSQGPEDPPHLRDKPLPLTGFDLLDDRPAVAVPHLPDVQQRVGVPVVGGPVVHEDPGAAAAAVHHDAVVQGRVRHVRHLHGLGHGEVPGGGGGGGGGAWGRPGLCRWAAAPGLGPTGGRPGHVEPPRQTVEITPLLKLHVHDVMQ